MATMHVEFFSEVLSLMNSMEVIIPQKPKGRKPPYPILYLLHGGSGNQTDWLRNTAIERYVEDMGLAVVMPSVQFSFYADQKYCFKYLTYLTEELPEIVREFFHISDRREDTFAVGLSMGGYGAFKLGIVCPEKYAAVASLSGSIDQRNRLTENSDLHNAVMQQMVYNTFGSYEEYDRSINDLHYTLESRIAAGVQLPRFFQACGTDDHNYRVNTAFHEAFKGRIDLTYEEAPGRGHTWDYWDECIVRVLKWLPIR